MASVKNIITSLPWRRISIAAGTILLLFVGVAVAGLLYIDTNTGRNQLAALLNENFKTPERTIHISGFEGSLYSALTIPLVTVADQQGVWLEANNTKLRWSLVALISKRLDFSSLEIEKVKIDRTPISNDEKSKPTNEPFSLPSLPMDIEISNYTINEIKVEEALAEIASEFKLGGALFLTRSNGIDAKMTFASTAGHKDYIDFDISFLKDSNDLEVKIDLMAPKAGLFQTLSDTILQGDAFVTFVGTGPLKNWHGDMNAKIDNQSFFNAAIKRVDQITNIDADFEINEFVPKEFKELIRGQNQLNLTLSPVERSGANDLDLTVTTDIANFKAHGMLSLVEPKETDTIDFTLDITKTDAINKFISPTYIKPTAIRGAFTNLMSSFSFSVNLPSLNIGIHDTVETTVQGKLDGYLENQQIILNSKGRVENITGSAVDAVAELLTPGINWSLNTEVDQINSHIKVNQFSLENDFAVISATAELDNVTSALTADVQGNIDNIEGIAKALNLAQPISGKVNASFEISQSESNAPLNAKIGLSTDNLNLGNETLNELVGPTPTFHAHLEKSASGALSLFNAALDASVIQFKADADVSSEQLINGAKFKLSFIDIENITSLKETALTGNIDILGTFSGDINDPSLNVETGFNQVVIQNLELQNFFAQLRADNILSDIKGKVGIESESNLGAFSASADFKKLGEGLQLPSLAIALGAYELVGALDIPSSKPISGSVNLITNEIAQNTSEIDGNIDAVINLLNENNNQRIRLESNATDISINLGENDVLALETGQVTADILLNDNTLEIKANAALTSFMHPNLQINDATINIDQQDSDISYTANFTGSDSMPFKLEIDGNMRQDTNGAQTITVTLDGAVNEEEIKLRQPMQVLLSETSVKVPDFTLQVGDGELNGNFEQNTDGRAAALKITNTNLEALKVFIPEIPITALLNGDLNFQSTLDTLTTSFSLGLSNIVSEEQNLSSDDKIALNILGKINQNNTDLSGTMTLEDRFNSEFSIAIPIEIDPATLETTLTDNTPLNGKANWTGDIAPIWPTLKLIDHDLVGNLTADLLIGGTISVPDIDGNIMLANGRYENMQTGFIASDIDMAASILNRQFTLDKFNANDGENGTIFATANVDVSPDLSYNAKVDLTLSDTRIVRQPELQITASSDLTFEKNNNSTSLNGDIIVENADIGAISQSGPAIAKLDVTEINAEGIIEKGSKQKDALGPIDLDLDLQVPGKLFIRSFGLDSEWAADLQVSGSSGEPIVDGTAELVRGYFEFSGKRFSLTRGTFSFPGNKTNDPVIEIAAEHQLSDMVANLRIFGLASNPSLEMSSTPYLPENEVMARILFGTSVAQLTAVEAVQLASAVHSLSNGGGQGLMGGIRRAIGVDRLSIDNDRSRDYGTTITGGKYLTDNVYVEVSTAPATGETATSVEVGLTRNLSLVTRRTLDHDNNLSIKWFRDY